MYRVLYRWHPGCSWEYQTAYTFLWEARRYVKKQIKKDKKVVKVYDKYVEYWP